MFLCRVPLGPAESWAGACRERELFNPLVTDSASMHLATVSALSDYYADVFGIDRAALWHSVTVRTHSGRLHGYEGYYVAWKDDGVHVSMPPSDGAEGSNDLLSEDVEALQSEDFWRDFARRRGLQVIGPSTHAYLDHDPGPADDGVAIPSKHDLRSLREAVNIFDWMESGWNDEPSHVFGLYEQGVLVAAANLNLFHQRPRDIGVVVASDMRGRGLSTAVAQHAASFAVRTHGFARWGARNDNVASLATASGLGFQRWCAQLAVR